MKKNKLKLGIFDSGAGGLSVLEHVLRAEIFDSIIYYGDTARLPYGTKHPDSIICFCLEALEFLLVQNVDMIIVACNTASAHALDAMQKAAPKIPIIGVIEPGILAIKNRLKNLDAKILVLGTKATIQSAQYQRHLEKLGYSNITAIPTSLFVSLVEEGIFEGPLVEECLRYYFGGIDFVPDAIILGCTHFPLLQKPIAAYFQNKSLLIHAGEAIVQYITQNSHLLFESKKSRSLLSTKAGIVGDLVDGAHKLDHKTCNKAAQIKTPHARNLNARANNLPRCNHTTLQFYASSDEKGLKNTAQNWLSSAKNFTIL
ncbi:glutamate racemase [Helicobacter mustelae]|nr:glutamate racemase [Helicobacter mustelae]